MVSTYAINHPQAQSAPNTIDVSSLSSFLHLRRKTRVMTGKNEILHRHHRTLNLLVTDFKYQ